MLQNKTKQTKKQNKNKNKQKKNRLIGEGLEANSHIFIDKWFQNDSCF